MAAPANVPDRVVELQRAAKALLPSVPELAERLTKPTHIAVAVQRHNKDQAPWSNALPKDHFVWIIGREKVTIRQIKESYEKTYENTVAVDLHLGDTLLTLDTRLGDINYFDSKLVAVLAVERSSSRPSTLTTPANTMDAQTPRPPLQPISQPNRAPPVKPDPESKQTLTDLPVPPPQIPPPSPQMKPEPDTEQIPPAADMEMDEWPASQEYQPRDVEYDPFVGQEDETEIFTRGQPLRQLSQNTTPERLEAGVREGVNALGQLRQTLQQVEGDADTANWLQQIDKLIQEAVKTRTVVGVVGNTGAGKSSVINAMLDEERLVPTNCMRACTAVVTELSYNYSNLENSRYRAEIEFIRPEDWRKELQVLFQEVIDDSGHISRDISNPDSQAGIAYAKIRAVYPTYTKEMLVNASVDSLMSVKRVRVILGTTKKVNTAQPQTFYTTLQKYVDSKEKGTEKLDKNGNKIGNRKREFEHWPLIKVVKIYTKADALSTGAVIVDLPGVHDSNAARAAVAEGYMKQCTGLWIVAPINRAVDDKAAKTLLGNTFKRQLKYDGTYSAVTFICSKTDDISRTEAADSLKLGTEMANLENKLAELERRRRKLQKELKSVREQKQDHVDAIDSIEDQLEKWEELKAKAEDGKKVYAPSSPKTKKKTNKRKRSSNSPVARKKRRSSVDDDDDDVILVDSETDEQDEGNDDVTTGTPLTEDDIDSRIKELQTLKKEARREKGNFDGQIRGLREKITEVEDEESKLDDRQSELCIAGRNEYSRDAIRHDFAAGIRELDQENAEEEDPDSFDPEKELRDYDEVERSLPVYCVSSRAYQKLCGRMQKDTDVPGFTNREQTEIPQLQAHCKKLTEQGRLASCRRFLNTLDQLVASLGLWASDDGTGAKLSVQQRDMEARFLDRKLKELEKALESAVINKLDDISETLDENLFDKFRPAIAAAAQEAVPTTEKWGAPRDQGGLHFMTYRATVRRSGVYNGASGHQDFNQQLFDPVQKRLATGWEKAFHRRLPNILQTFTKAATEILHKFHQAIEARCKATGHGVGRMGILSSMLTAHQAVFNDLIAAAITSVNDGQRDINREFTPVITSCMEPAYEHCSADAGPGVFKRCKSHMADHVDREKGPMFNQACEQVRASLSGLVEKVRQQMLDRVDGVYVNMRSDYMRVIGGVNVQQIKMSREQRAVRRDVDEVLSGVDDAFTKILDCEVEDLKVEEELQDGLEGEEEDGGDDELDVDEEGVDDEEGSGVGSKEEEDDHEEDEVVAGLSRHATVESDYEEEL